MYKPLEIEYKPISSRSLPEYISATTLPGLFTIERPVMGDERGDFWEVARIEDLEIAVERPFKVKQINRSRNVLKGTLRGIHVADWDKLVSVVRGSAFIALVDLRKNSPSFKKTFTTIIGDETKTQSILIPAGFGNSYQTLSDKTDYIYAVSDVWSVGREIGIAWNDPELAIDWPLKTPILSEKDRQNPFLQTYF